MIVSTFVLDNVGLATVRAGQLSAQHTLTSPHLGVADWTWPGDNRFYILYFCQSQSLLTLLHPRPGSSEQVNDYMLQCCNVGMFHPLIINVFLGYHTCSLDHQPGSVSWPVCHTSSQNIYIVPLISRAGMLEKMINMVMLSSRAGDHL